MVAVQKSPRMELLQLVEFYVEVGSWNCHLSWHWGRDSTHSLVIWPRKQRSSSQYRYMWRYLQMAGHCSFLGRQVLKWVQDWGGDCMFIFMLYGRPEVFQVDTVKLRKCFLSGRLPGGGIGGETKWLLLHFTGRELFELVVIFRRWCWNGRTTLHSHCWFI